ncbi:MerR family transcriptional regulator [Maribellus sediminis]|uniref:MerR family transcriptional regulator n=1 Tax=Maribellus sediminis TaxID=2696285 RepID=UPI001430A6F6|nr:MerR family transcriptional regulator [Maribellus sediminis]
MSQILHNDSEPIYTLSIAAKLSNTPAHSIRQYIDKGLLIPYKKDTNRHLFSAYDIQRLIWIKKSIEERGLNFAGIKTQLALIPCWKITGCKSKSRNTCDAYYSNDQPCWLASEKGKECKNKECRLCEVYRLMLPDTDVKAVFKRFMV